MSSGDLIIRSGAGVTMDPVLGDIPDGDVLVTGGRIGAVRPGLDAPRARELDARGMIVAPGLVETHWHTWNTLLRSMSGGMAGEDRPAGYFSVSLGLGRVFTDDDNYQGTLLACAEAINSGITTVHDWSHNVRGAAHAEAGLRALAEAGLRARYSYGYSAGIPGRPVRGHHRADRQRRHVRDHETDPGADQRRRHQEFACTARQALALGTLEGARSLGLDGVTGSLTPGKRADIILVDTGHRGSARRPARHWRGPAPAPPRTAVGHGPGWPNRGVIAARVPRWTSRAHGSSLRTRLDEGSRPGARSTQPRGY